MKHMCTWANRMCIAERRCEPADFCQVSRYDCRIDGVHIRRTYQFNAHKNRAGTPEAHTAPAQATRSHDWATPKYAPVPRSSRSPTGPTRGAPPPWPCTPGRRATQRPGSDCTSAQTQSKRPPSLARMASRARRGTACSTGPEFQSCRIVHPSGILGWK